MNVPKDVGFSVGQIGDGRYAAASTNAPYFCFVESTEVAAVDKAHAAFDFYFSQKGSLTRKPQVPKQVVNFVPQRRVDASKEYACA